MFSAQKKLQNKRSQAPYAPILSLARTVSSVFHRYPNYPTLPEKTPKENRWVHVRYVSLSAQCWLVYGCRLPLQIGSKVLEEAYNHFLEHNTSKGYKFYWNNGNVYIVGMAKDEHERIVLRLIRYFEVPNGGVDDDPPIDLALQACKKSLWLFFDLLDLWIIITFTFFPTVHRDPSHIKIKIAADIAICPDIALVQNPLNPGPPPGNADVNV